MADIQSLQQRLHALQNFRRELVEIHKQAFMAAPPMPAPQGAPMDPNMMGGMPPGGPPMGGPPMGGPPIDPNTGMPMGGPPMGGPPIDPNTGMPMGGPPIDPNTGMPMGGPPPQQGGSPITPEMLDELLGVVEQLAAGHDQQEQRLAKYESMLQDCMSACDEAQRAVAELSSVLSAQPAQPSAPASWS